MVEQDMSETSSSSCPPYETVPSIYSHHGQLWAGTPPHFLDHLYEDLDDLKNELLGFIVYYNEHRPHSSLNGMTPLSFSNHVTN